MPGLEFNSGHFLAIFIVFLFSGKSLACPDACQCSSALDLQVIEISGTETSGFLTSCENSDLSEIPQIPANTEFLNFSGNSLTYLDEMSFRGRQYLEILDVSYNAIETIGNETFAGLKNLRKIDLSWNKLFSLHPEIFAGLESKSVTVDVTGNPMRCNCRLKRAWDQIFSKPGLSHIGGVCSSPKEYKGDAISGLDEVCEDKLNGHDITLIILAVLTVILATILNFSSPLKRTVVSCQSKFCSQTDSEGECQERIKNAIISSKSARDPEREKGAGNSQQSGQTMMTIGKCGSYTVDETSLSNSANSALDYFSNQQQQRASGSSQGKKSVNRLESSGSNSFLESRRNNWNQEEQSSRRSSQIQVNRSSSRDLNAKFSADSKLDSDKYFKETEI